MAKIKRKSIESGGTATADAAKESIKGKYWKVELAASKHGAVVKSESRSDAKERFLELFGILGTDQKVTAVEVEYKHGLAVREIGKNYTEADCRFRGEGIVDYFHGGHDNRTDGKGRDRKANADNGEADDGDDE